MSILRRPGLEFLGDMTVTGKGVAAWGLGSESPCSGCGAILLAVLILAGPPLAQPISRVSVLLQAACLARMMPAASNSPSFAPLDLMTPFCRHTGAVRGRSSHVPRSPAAVQAPGWSPAPTLHDVVWTETGRYGRGLAPRVC